MTSIDKDTITRLGHLAKISIDDHAEPQLETDLNKILHLVDSLKTLDTHDVQPLLSPLELMQCPAPLRDDKVTASNERELFQADAPSHADGLYLVPDVIE